MGIIEKYAKSLSWISLVSGAVVLVSILSVSVPMAAGTYTREDAIIPGVAWGVASLVNLIAGGAVVEKLGWRCAKLAVIGLAPNAILLVVGTIGGIFGIWHT